MKSLTKLSVATKGLTIFVAGLFFVSGVQAQEMKIGVVSTERIFREAAPYKAAQVKIEQEFSKRQKELQDLANRLKTMADKLDKDAAVLSDSDRTKRQRELAEVDKDFQRTQREFKEDLNQRRNEEMANVIDRTNKVIKQIAEAEKYDIVLQEAVYISPRIDITDKVLKALSK
ncbi:OmpH family outer membrane protein [Herminiimonas aquatilis]|uniref:OmpH family outer membrane protein n=1 Tax=Herminiimonas aquatilis TaxID=345342 RepID=A0ABW2J7D9_9BURK